MIVVVPSNRQIDLAHFEPLIARQARFIVDDDGEGTISIDHPSFTNDVTVAIVAAAPRCATCCILCA